ncbi:MAG TPA: radical SAM protein, partial [Chitinophagaceae bacterium]|nr:radical SAM protein [Chitinophagaceae bacterium]
MLTPVAEQVLNSLPQELIDIQHKVYGGERITDEEGIFLFENGSLPFLGSLANYIREKKHGDITYFNRNFHIEPTNVCVFTCNFCSYSRLYARREEGWELSTEQMLHIVRKYDGLPVTEVHIVGGVHPKMNIEFFADVLRKIKAHRPSLHIKGFTAVELDYMFRKARMSNEEGLIYLKNAGLDSLPGGGAEIFDEEIREKICADKVDARGWLAIHEAAHKLGMHSNA